MRFGMLPQHTWNAETSKVMPARHPDDKGLGSCYLAVMASLWRNARAWQAWTHATAGRLRYRADYDCTLSTAFSNEGHAPSDTLVASKTTFPINEL